MHTVFQPDTIWEGDDSSPVPITALTDRMADGVVVLDENGLIRFHNPAFATLLDRSAGQINGKAVRELLEQTSRFEFASRWSARRGGARDKYVLIWLRGDGSKVKTTVLPSPLYHADGRFAGSLGVIVSSVERDGLREELAVAQRIVEHSATVLYRVRIEPGFPIEFISGNVAHFGYDIESLRNGQLHFAEVVHPSDFDRVFREVMQNVRAGVLDFVQNYRIRKPDGSVRWVDDNSRVTTRSAGEHYLEGLLTDVTERYLACEGQRKALLQTVSALGATIDKRDAYTAGHQNRVAALSLAIGHVLELDDHTCEGIYLGALIHDLGKIAVPAEILAKPARLSPEEYALVKVHVQAGLDVLNGVEFPWPIAEMIGQHHERLDGSGYPRGLKGEEIIQEARIIAVADVVESMSGHRPYRPALGLEAAVAELRKHRGTLFDAQVVDACIGIIDEFGPDAARLWKVLETTAAREIH